MSCLSLPEDKVCGVEECQVILQDSAFVVNLCKGYGTLSAGVLELIDFIRRENIKTLVEHIVDQHIER